MLSCDCTETYIAYAKEHAASGEYAPWYGSIDLDTASYGYKLLDKVFAIMNGENPEAYTGHFREHQRFLRLRLKLFGEMSSVPEIYFMARSGINQEVLLHWATRCSK